jgi:hypothetical protein
MNKVLVIYDGTTQVYSVDEDRSAQFIAESLNVTDPAFYQEFPESDFDGACYNFSGAFTLVNGVVSFDLSKAKQIAEVIVNAQSNEAASKALEGLSYDVYVAQCSLPAEQRIAKYQAAIDANNALAIETENREQAVYAASTIQEVNAIVYPLKD